MKCHRLLPGALALALSVSLCACGGAPAGPSAAPSQALEALTTGQTVTSLTVAGGSTVNLSAVAARYGYESPTAFNRAFRAVHGVAPSQVRSGSVAVKCYPRLVFHLTVQGGEEMQYRIETKAAFRVVGISRPLDREIENNFREVPLMWDAAARDGTVAALAARMDGEPKGLLGISACAGGEAWRYLIAVASQAEPGSFETYTVPAATWAVFSGEGTGRSIQTLEKRIVTEWLPGSGYEYADGPDIEVYLEPDPLHTRYEVWVPVTRRRE